MFNLYRGPAGLLSPLTFEASQKSSPISAPLREALNECFRATTRLARPELRRQLVLVGGAASIAHGSVLYTEDVDVAAPCDVLHDICKGVMDGRPQLFSRARRQDRVRCQSRNTRPDRPSCDRRRHRTDPRGRAFFRGFCCVHVGLVETEGRDGG